MELVFLAILGVCGIWYASWYTSADETHKRALRAAPTFTLAEMPEDRRCRVIGQAYAQGAAGPILRGPLSNRECLMYVVTVEEQVNNGRGTAWRTLIQESQAVPFMLTDGTGKALVDPTHAHTVLEFDCKSQSGLFDPADATETAFLAKHGHTSTGWLFNRGLRYREAVVHIGESITVLGLAVREPDPDGTPSDGYRSAAPTRVRLTSSAKYPLVISDHADITKPSQRTLSKG